MLPARKLVAAGIVFAVAASGIALAETASDQQHQMGPDHMQQMMQSGKHPMAPGQMQEMLRQHQGMMGAGGMHGTSATPMMPGQDAFGAIQEIVRILDADPKTDWSKVDLEALRQHLIDMNEVTLKADAAATPIDGGVEVAITGTGRTLIAIQRMIPAYAQNVNGFNGWAAKAASLPNGELLTVTSTDPKEIQHIRGLGFIGLLVSGSMHQPHHLAMAKGEFDHQHLHQAH
jgi:hypothetical protein